MRRAMNRRPTLGVERLEDRTTPASVHFFATGTGPGTPGLVNVYELLSGTSVRKVASFYPYDLGFKGGVTVSTADVNGDGVDDIITGPGPGRAPTVNVVDGASLLKGQVALLRSFNAYDPAFLGGVSVAATSGTFAVDGSVITGAGPGGGPHVRVFDFQTLAVTRQFYAYDPKFRGGVRVGTFPGGMVTGAGPGGGPHVKVYNADGSLKGQFYAFAPTFTGGVFVADGLGVFFSHGESVDFVVTPGRGGPPEARLYCTRIGEPALLLDTVTPYPNFAGGLTATVLLAESDLGTNLTYLVTAPGPGGGPDVRIYQEITLNPVLRFNAYDPTFLGGVNVGGGF